MYSLVTLPYYFRCGRLFGISRLRQELVIVETNSSAILKIVSSPKEEVDHCLPDFSKAAFDYVTGFFEKESSLFVRNAQTEMIALWMGNLVLPATVTWPSQSNSYVVSCYNQYVTYAIEELRTINSWVLRALLNALLRLTGFVLRLGEIDKTVMVNNWLLSTNLHGPITDQQIVDLTQSLVLKYPGHTILFRSVDSHERDKMASRFQSLGFRMVISRQVYIIEPKEALTHKTRSLERDFAVARRYPLTHRTNSEFSETDYPRVIDLYNQLYLGKYSLNNPQFTVSFVKHCHEVGTLKLHGLADQMGVLVAVFGYFERNGFMTSPLFGYDFDIPKEWGLYRQLMRLQLTVARERDLLLHLSSGAASFKVARGAKPALEFHAVCCDHLPFWRRLPWIFLEFLTKWVAVPIFQRFKI